MSSAESGWRGWDALSGGTARSVTSERLGGNAEVKNGLFPKTRSWFTLGAPLELLSPLSVLRIVVALDALLWPILLFGVSSVGVAWVPVALAEGLVTVTWVALLKLRHVSRRGSLLLGLLLGACGAVVLGAAGSGATAPALGAFNLPLVVFLALFFPLRVVLAELALLVVLDGVGYAAHYGPGASAADVAAEALCLGLVVVAVAVLVRSSRRQGSIDPDSGLLNALGLASALRDEEPGAGRLVAAVQLEGIDEARQALGHGVGIELLRRAVEHLGQVAPAHAIIGRIEGDELIVAGGVELGAGAKHPTPAVFAALNEAGELLANSLAQAISAGRFLVDGIEVTLRAHVGVAYAASDEEPIAELLRRASLAARSAADHRLAYALFEGEEGMMTAEDLSLLAALSQAVARRELSLAYQPQVVATTNALASVEALLRWDDPVRGPVSPGRFIPLAERTGLIDRLTEFAFAEALDAQVRWRERGIELPVSVNLSARTLTRPDLVARIRDELESRGLPPSCLSLEVTETAEVADLVLAVDLLRPLHEFGVRISIDDFGTGYTSLALLPELPLDELKVDQHFVLRVLESDADAAIVETVCELAHRLDLVAVAEGVEDDAIRARIVAVGYDLLQGFAIARPLEEAALLALVASDQGAPRPV